MAWSKQRPAHQHGLAKPVHALRDDLRERRCLLDAAWADLERQLSACALPVACLLPEQESDDEAEKALEAQHAEVKIKARAEYVEAKQAAAEHWQKKNYEECTPPPRRSESERSPSLGRRRERDASSKFSGELVCHCIQ